MMLEENTIVADRFRLIRMIGRGGMGSVWRAFDTRLDIACALKFIEGELANVAEAHSRFEREAKAAAALRSPHVVEIKDYGVWEGRPYIAMELLEGEDLGKALAKAGGKLPPGQISNVMQQVCRALTKAHAAGIVHRDLKPDNIFLVNDDDRQLVKILDFGVAKQTSQAIEGSNTKTGAMLGTPYYMSPEQAQGIKTVDSRSDLWSLAVIVYHCLTGRLPFESEALGDLLVKIIVNPIPVPSQVAHVPPGFDRWWAKAAERNPDARYQTAKDFSNELAMALGTTSDVAQRSSGPHLQGTAMMAGGSHGGGAPGYPAGHGTTPHPGTPTPHGMAPGAGVHTSLGGAANPATFSGVEPPITIPKKGPPLGLVGGLAAFALVAVLGVGVLVSRRTAPASPEPSAPSSLAAATPPASATPSGLPPEPAAPPAAETAETAAAGASASASVAASPSIRPGVAPPAAAPRTAAAPLTGNAPGKPPPAKPTSTSAPAPPPTASAKKWNPGF